MKICVYQQTSWLARSEEGNGKARKAKKRRKKSRKKGEMK